MQISDFKNLEKDIKKLLSKQLPTELANHAVNFFKESFTRQGWAGKSFKRWQKTRTKSQTFGKNSGILIQSGNLKKSIRISKLNSAGFVIRAGNQKVTYASIHNQGGYISVTPKSRRFFWYMYKKTGEEMWKYMALSKKTKFKMPQRQFIGESETLNKELVKTVQKRLNETFHKYINYK